MKGVRGRQILFLSYDVYLWMAEGTLCHEGGAESSSALRMLPRALGLT